MRNPRKTPRLAAALALAVGTLTAFAALGGVGLAQTSSSAGQYQYGKKKVTICHKGKRTIRVSKAAARAHLRHGDTLGKCDRATTRGRKHGKAHKGHERAQKAAGKPREHAGKGQEAKARGESDEPREQERPGKGERGGRG